MFSWVVSLLRTVVIWKRTVLILSANETVFSGGQFVSGSCYLKAVLRTVFLGRQPVADCCYLETVLILSANKTVFFGGQFVSGCCSAFPDFNTGIQRGTQILMELKLVNLDT